MFSYVSPCAYETLYALVRVTTSEMLGMRTGY